MTDIEKVVGFLNSEGCFDMADEVIELQTEMERLHKELVRVKYINETLANRLYLNKLPHNVAEMDF